MIPPRLRPGDTIGIVSPSWGGAGAYPHRIQAGIASLESLGFKTILSSHALEQHGHVSDSPVNRAADIHEMFRAPKIVAIIAAIGGDHSCQVLPHLDFALIADHPKIFMGYSDITVLNIAIWKETGLVTFNGPTAIVEFAEYPKPHDYTMSSFKRSVCSNQPVGQIVPSEYWTDETLDWNTKADLERPRKLNRSSGWTWLRPGRAEGVLVGGCIESLQHLRGTRYWPDFSGKILFLETSEDHPSPATVDGILMDYENMGVLQNLRGLLFGRPMRYSEQEKLDLQEVILDRTAQYSFPIITDMDFGHTSPQFVLPIGCRARIDSEARVFELIEACVS